MVALIVIFSPSLITSVMIKQNLTPKQKHLHVAVINVIILTSNRAPLFSGRPRGPANPYPDRAATPVGQLLGDHDLRVVHTPIHGARDRLQLVPLASAW